MDLASLVQGDQNTAHGYTVTCPNCFEYVGLDEVVEGQEQSLRAGDLNQRLPPLLLTARDVVAPLHPTGKGGGRKVQIARRLSNGVDRNLPGVEIPSCIGERDVWHLMILTGDTGSRTYSTDST